MHISTEWAGKNVGCASIRIFDVLCDCVCRTARAHEQGTALTFMTPGEEKLLSQLELRVGKGGHTSGSAVSLSIKPYKFRMSEVEGFRYRVKVHLEQQL